jgi:exopolyphosphatase/pppGpp-phosphohydrolase
VIESCMLVLRFMHAEKIFLVATELFRVAMDKRRDTSGHGGSPVF